MRKLLALVAAAVLLAGGGYYGLVIYPDQQFHAEIEQALTLAPAGWSIKYKVAHYSLFDSQAEVAGIEIHGPAPLSIDGTIDAIEISKPNLSLAAEWAKAAADPKGVSRETALRVSDRITMLGVKYKLAETTPAGLIEPTETIDSATMVGLALRPAALLQLRLKDFADWQERFVKLQQQRPPQPPQLTDIQPLLKDIAALVLGFAYDHYDIENLRVSSQIPAQAQVPAMALTYEVRKATSGRIDQGVIANAALEGLKGEISPFGSFTLDRVSVAGCDLHAMLEQFLAGDVPTAAMLDGVKLGRLEYAGLSVPKTPLGPISLGSFAISNIAVTRGVPVSGALALTGFRVTRAMAVDPRSAELFRLLGLDALTLNFAAAYSWDLEKRQMAISGTSFKIDELGAISLAAEFADMAPSPASPIQARLTHAVLRYEDASLMERAFRAGAAKNGGDPAAIRQQFLAAMQDQGAAFADKPAIAAIVKAVTAFVGAPRSLVVELTPTEPLLLTRFQALQGLPPPDLVALLGLTVAANQ